MTTQLPPTPTIVNRLRHTLLAGLFGLTALLPTANATTPTCTDPNSTTFTISAAAAWKQDCHIPAGTTVIIDQFGYLTIKKNAEVHIDTGATLIINRDGDVNIKGELHVDGLLEAEGNLNVARGGHFEVESNGDVDLRLYDDEGQIAAAQGATVIATAGSVSKRELLRQR